MSACGPIERKPIKQKMNDQGEYDRILNSWKGFSISTCVSFIMLRYSIYIYKYNN